MITNKDLENLVEHLKQDGYLKTLEIIDAFLNIDRIDFVPSHLKEDAYLNIPLQIGEGQTISQPLTVAFMLELLEPKAGDKILDIGSGSGWTSAILAKIVGNKGRVVAVERVPELCEVGKKNIEKYGFIKKGIVEYICGDGTKDIKKLAARPELARLARLVFDSSKRAGARAKRVEGFDKIIAAAAGGAVPDAWKKQLKIGGRIVMPIKNSIIQLDKVGENKFEEKEFVGFSFVPLIS